MKILLSLLILIYTALPTFSQIPSAALTGDRTFQSSSATAAQRRYFETLRRERTAYAADLELAIKAAVR